MSRIVECVPNFSEGRRTDIIEAIVEPFRKTPGVKLLDYSPDADHNRMVVTAVGDPARLPDAVFEAVRIASTLIDMEQHQGAHPRMGATDVVPLIPIREVKMEECVALARDLGRRIGDELGIPVFLYEAAATSPARVNLADIRKGEYEGWKTKIALAEWAPDFGPARLHPTAGATVVGARMPLIAFNVNLNTQDIKVANAIARAIRHISGGLRYVKALGVELKDRGMVQVSINMTDYTRTPLYRALELIRAEARRYGVSVAETEIVGLTPVQALVDAAAYYLQLSGFSPDTILENRLQDWPPESGEVG
ncbi:MAG: glutamate formimidoyltransferase [Firmicutes bacterium]|jgi:glutamate formiminotransferase|nr:glutamate formimidoyltransferase [Bacillota bacterium]